MPGAWAFRGQHREDLHDVAKHRDRCLSQRAGGDPRRRADDRRRDRRRARGPALLAMGNWLSDKYAEGTIGRRFYAGCAQVDVVESVAAEHARELFGAPHAYVQPHSGIDANLVAYWAVLADRVEGPALQKLGARQVNELSDADWAQLRGDLGNQRMLGMSLDAGGHLTHGFRPNISGKMFDQRSYGTDPETGLLDYAELRRTALDFRPLILVAG